jgi:hypothetical protein
MVPAFLIRIRTFPHSRLHEIRSVPFFVLLSYSEGVRDINLTLQTGHMTLVRGFGLPRDPSGFFAEVLPKQTYGLPILTEP